MLDLTDICEWPKYPDYWALKRVPWALYRTAEQQIVWGKLVYPKEYPESFQLSLSCMHFKDFIREIWLY